MLYLYKDNLMQTFITDFDFYTSASNLNRQHLQANIYEGIHILASLLDVNDKLVNPKRNVKNHPASKLWVGYEQWLLEYITNHIDLWENKGYRVNINAKNYLIIFEEIKKIKINEPFPNWITDELIQTHRSVLIQKEIEKEKELKTQIENLEDAGIYDEKDIEIKNIFLNDIKINMKKIEKLNHYRNLWPDCPVNLKMRYDWKENLENTIHI